MDPAKSDENQSVTRKLCLACDQQFTEDLKICPKDGTTLVIIEKDQFLGKIINDRYQILKPLGKGGMGAVYLAEQAVLKRRVAVKMLHAQLSEDKVSVKRFEQEASASSDLQHPHLITLYDYGMIDSKQPYIVMEYLEGESVAEIFKREGPLNPVRCARILSQVMDALHYAHNKGVLHRDIKPSNIILIEKDGSKDFVKIVDFGLAKLMPWSGKESQHLTKTGEVFGSPVYMSPEQCMGKKLEPSSDIYSVGITLFEILTGEPPFRGRNVVQTASMHISNTPPSFDKICPDLNLSEKLQAVVFKALEKDPAHRFLSMMEFKEALNNAVSGTEISKTKTAISKPAVDTTQPIKRENLEEKTASNRKAELKKPIAALRQTEIKQERKNLRVITIAALSLSLVVLGGLFFVNESMPKTALGTVYYLDTATLVKNGIPVGINISDLHLHTDKGLLRLASDLPLNSGLLKNNALAVGTKWQVTYKGKDLEGELLEERTAGTEISVHDANQVILNHFAFLASQNMEDAWKTLSQRYIKSSYAKLSDNDAFQQFSTQLKKIRFIDYSDPARAELSKNPYPDFRYGNVVEAPTKGTKAVSVETNKAIFLVDSSVFLAAGQGYQRYTLIKEENEWKIDQIEPLLNKSEWNKY